MIVQVNLVSTSAAAPSKKLLANLAACFEKKYTDAALSKMAETLIGYSSKKVLNSEALDKFLAFLRTSDHESVVSYSRSKSGGLTKQSLMALLQSKNFDSITSNIHGFKFRAPKTKNETATSTKPVSTAPKQVKVVMVPPHTVKASPFAKFFKTSNSKADLLYNYNLQTFWLGVKNMFPNLKVSKKTAKRFILRENTPFTQREIMALKSKAKSLRMSVQDGPDTNTLILAI